MKTFLILLGLMGLTQLSLAAKGGDPILTKVMVDQLEVREESGEQQNVLEGQVWIGQDLNKLWIKLDSDYENSDDYETELQLLYSKAVAPYWDLQMGVRSDNSPDENETWAVLGVQGLAPYYFETDAAAFLSEDGDLAFNLSFEYELLFTQKLVLSPELSLDMYAQDDDEAGVGSGLAASNLGLRLRYEMVREFAPYIGISQSNLLGNTKDLVEDVGGSTSSTQYVAGFRAWF